MNSLSQSDNDDGHHNYYKLVAITNSVLFITSAITSKIHVRVYKTNSFVL